MGYKKAYNKWLHIKKYWGVKDKQQTNKSAEYEDTYTPD